MQLRKGLLAEYETPDALVTALNELRKRGFRRLDAYTPYPLLAAERAIGLFRSRICWVVFPFAITAATVAYLVQWWCNAVDYPLNVGGRPPHSAPAFVPITFEMAVLFTGLTALAVLCVYARLPTLWEPIFEVPGFERASIDRFFLAVDETDPAFDRDTVTRLLESMGALRVVPVGLTGGPEEEKAPPPFEGGELE
jgi:hypothetical protein